MLIYGLFLEHNGPGFFLSFSWGGGFGGFGGIFGFGIWDLVFEVSMVSMDSSSSGSLDPFVFVFWFSDCLSEVGGCGTLV